MGGSVPLALSCRFCSQPVFCALVAGVSGPSPACPRCLRPVQGMSGSVPRASLIAGPESALCEAWLRGHVGGGACPPGGVRTRTGWVRRSLHHGVGKGTEPRRGGEVSRAPCPSEGPSGLGGGSVAPAPSRSLGGVSGGATWRCQLPPSGRCALLVGERTRPGGELLASQVWCLCPWRPAVVSRGLNGKSAWSLSLTHVGGLSLQKLEFPL